MALPTLFRLTARDNIKARLDAITEGDEYRLTPSCVSGNPSEIPFDSDGEDLLHSQLPFIRFYVENEDDEGDLASITQDTITLVVQGIIAPDMHGFPEEDLVTLTEWFIADVRKALDSDPALGIEAHLLARGIELDYEDGGEYAAFTFLDQYQYRRVCT